MSGKNSDVGKERGELGEKARSKEERGEREIGLEETGARDILNISISDTEADGIASITPKRASNSKGKGGVGKEEIRRIENRIAEEMEKVERERKRRDEYVEKWVKEKLDEQAARWEVEKSIIVRKLDAALKGIDKERDEQAMETGNQEEEGILDSNGEGTSERTGGEATEKNWGEKLDMTTAPKILSKEEENWERGARWNKKRNLYVKGWEGRDVEECRRYLQKNLKLEIRGRGKKTEKGVIFELNSMWEKMELMKRGRERLGNANFKLGDDLTYRERKIQRWIGALANEEREKGRMAIVGYGKIRGVFQ